jgi:hypothetical protein
MDKLTAKVVVDCVSDATGETLQVVFDGSFSLSDCLNMAEISNAKSKLMGAQLHYDVYVVDVATDERVKVSR